MNYLYLYIICFLFLINIPLSAMPAEFDLPPLFYHGRDEDYKSEKDFLGPFITIKNDDQRKEFGVRPLFYWLENDERDHSEMDILYPLFGYWHDDDLKSYQMLLHLIKYKSNKLENGGTEREFTLFPFIFYKDSPVKENGYFGLFPFTET